MGIKRGVSLYSYQQAQIVNKMDWRAQLKEIATNLDGANGIEIISQATVPQFPFPSERFIAEWNYEMARWGFVGTAMDIFPDPLQIRRDHVMTDAELAERIKIELRLAAKMGFKYVRGGGNLNITKMALPVCEETGVGITFEIHAVASIKGDPRFKNRNRDRESVLQIAEFIYKTGTKYVGLQPDFGIFSKGTTFVNLAHWMRRKGIEDWEMVARAICDKSLLVGEDELNQWIADKYPHYFPDAAAASVATLAAHIRGGSDPDELRLITPYIKLCHGKFYQMTEIPGKPGQYEEASINYYDGIRVLNDIGYDGYISSEFEGQRSCQDRGIEFMSDEVTEVRRHHEMMKRLIEETKRK